MDVSVALRAHHHHHHHHHHTHNKQYPQATTQIPFPPPPKNKPTQVYIACLNDRTGYEIRSKSTEFGGSGNDLVAVR